MRVFITGATGILGKRVVKLLVDQSIEVFALCRSASNEKVIRSLGGIPVPGDLFNLSNIITSTKNCDAILNLATAIPKKDRPSLKDWKLNDRIRMEGTKILLEAAKVNQIDFFLQQSIALLYGNRKGEKVTSTTPISNQQFTMLHSAKVMEEIVQQSSVSYTVIRFGSFYSTDSVQTQQLIQGVKKRKIPILGKKDIFWNMIHIDDAAAAIAYVLGNKEDLQNKVLNISDFNPISFKNILSAIASASGSKKPFTIPRWLGKLVLGKDLYGVMTSSYKIVKENSMNGWKPNYPHFMEGVKSIIINMT
jgi:nucleoside-diphosphate-sugar epimerase